MATSEDPDEYLMEAELERKNPLRVPDSLERIENRLHYFVSEIKVLTWIIIILLGLILWRVWH